MSAAVAVVGHGPTRVLVLHGWALDSSVWRWAMPSVDGDAFTYALVDFPGYGRAGDRPAAEGIDDMADAALAAADDLGWSRFSLLGHSMGGTTALRLAGRRPERVERVCALTPIGAAGFPVDDESRRRFAAAWPDAGWIIRFVSPELGAERVQALEDLSAATLGRETWARYLANWTGADFLADVRPIAPPVAILIGARDPIATREHLADTIAALGRPDVVTLPDAAHYPMVERPAACVAAWERALRVSQGAPAG